MRRTISKENGVYLLAENRLPFGDNLPLLRDSMDLLRELKDKKIVSILKLYDRPPSWYAAKDFGFPPSQLFKHAGGPVFFIFEPDICIGFYGSDFNDSVLVWRENLPPTYDYLEKKFALIIESGSLIDCKDEHFGDAQCANVLGRRIKHLTIFKTVETDIITVRNERGLLVGLDDGTEFLISKKLQKNCDFTLMSSERVRKSLEPFMKLIEVY